MANGGIFNVIRRGDQPQVEAWLESGRASAADKDVEGNTPLHVAVEVLKNEIAIMQTLIVYGSNVNEPNAIGATPLHYVALRKSKARPVANVLLEQAADPNARTVAGKTPLHFACQKNAVEFVEVLLLCQADVGLSGSQGELPIHDLLASPGRDTVKVEILDLLLRHNATLDAFDGRRRYPLHLAAQQGFLRVVHRLLEAKCSAEERTAQGELPVHLAAEAGHSETTQALAAAAPLSLDLQDVRGNTPLHRCAMAGQSEAACVLIKSGASVNVTNAQQHTPLELASVKSKDLFSTHNPELVALLQDKKKQQCIVS